MTDPAPSPRHRPRTLAGRLLRVPALVLVALYFLLDDVVLAAIRPLVAAVEKLAPVRRLAALIDRLPPYPTLILFLVPFAVLEPVKLVGLWMTATGHVRSGLLVLTLAHLASIVVVERLFHATRAKLLTIGWFAWIYERVTALYDWSVGRLKETEAWRRAAAMLHAAGRRIRAALVAVRAGLARFGIRPRRP